MYKCRDCESKFEFPEVKNLDAGHGEGILGFPIRNSIMFCPKCMSININVVKQMSKMKCDENCAECGKYTVMHSNGGEYIRYECLVADKTVIKKDGESE